MRLDPGQRRTDRLFVGRLAGVLFVGGSISGIPVDELLRPAVGLAANVMTVATLLAGVTCLLVPWNRVPARWLHVIPLTGTAMLALKMWSVGEHAEIYVWFLVFIAVFAAFAFEERRVVAAHVGLATSLAAYPILVAEAAERPNAIAEALTAVPIVLVATAAVVHLRERLVAAAGALAAEARSDALTGVGNYRLLEERLGYELTRHRRNGRALSLVVLDLDGFKAVNDILGHPAGDDLLRQVGRVLRATVRDQDTVVRQGGDEFCVLAPETDAEEAAALVARIKHELGELVAVEGRLSASAGCATFPQDGSDAEGLLTEADRAQRGDKAVRRSLAVAR